MNRWKPEDRVLRKINGIEKSERLCCDTCKNEKCAIEKVADSICQHYKNDAKGYYK